MTSSSGQHPSAPQPGGPTRDGAPRGTIVAAIITAIGAVVAALVGVAFARSDPAPSPTPIPPAPSVTVTTPAGSGPGITTGSVALAVTPPLVPLGSGFTITGSGYPAFALVQIDANGQFFTSASADAAGAIALSWPAIDASYCPYSPLQLTATVEGRVVASTTVRFCG